jgi:hypothetical protein
MVGGYGDSSARHRSNTSQYVALGIGEFNDLYADARWSGKPGTTIFRYFCLLAYNTSPSDGSAMAQFQHPNTVKVPWFCCELFDNTQIYAENNFWLQVNID